MLNITLSKKIADYWINSNDYYSMQNKDKFQKYFLSFINSKNINSKNIDKNLHIYDIQDTDEIINKNKINLLLCVENCNFWKHYKHINKYGNFGNKNISIYLYNHFNTFIETDNYIVIPIIYLQLDYFNNYYNIIKPSIYTPFDKKKFCLFITAPKKGCNKKVEIVINLLNSLGTCDKIQNYKNIIANKSCYHDITLLNLLNQYKFILCFENSITDGYITEKIFNVYFARAIPLYYGPSDKYKYFNKESFIDIEHLNIKQLYNLNKNESLYNNFINNKIVNDFDKLY